MVQYEWVIAMNLSGFYTMHLSTIRLQDNDALSRDAQVVCDHALIEVLSANVERERIDRGFTRVELCRLANIRTTTLYNLEHCTSYARLDTIEKLARALEVPPADLLRF